MAGFFFNNPDGTRQFDSNAWPCFGVVSRVNVPSSAPTYGSDLPVAFAKEYTFSITATAPLVALRVPGSVHPLTGNPRKAAGIARASRSGSTWTFTIWIFSQIDEWGFTYYVLDRMPGANVSGGLTYWDDTGGVIFSSELPYAQVVTSTTSGRSYAAVAFASARMQDEFIDDFNNPYVIWSVDGEGVYDLGAGPVRGQVAIDGGTVSGTTGPSYPGAGHDAWSGFAFDDLIIDVTDADGGLVDDYSLNAIDWPNASGSTVNPTLSFSSVQRSAAGINRDVSLTIAATLSGNLSTSVLRLMSTTRGELEDWTVTGTKNVAVQPNETLYFTMEATTSAGVRTGAWAISIVNASDGNAAVDSLTLTGTVDSDNDYNVTDVTPDAVNWTNITVGPTAENGLTFSNGWQTISGVNQTLNLRARITAFSGNAAQLWAEVHLYRAGTGDAIGAIPFGLNNQTTWTATNGQQFLFGGYVVSADAGHQTGSLTVTIYNDSDGGAALDTFTIGWNIDTDNSSLPPDYTPDALGFTSQSQSTAAEYLMLASGYKSVTGITAPITIRATITAVTGNIQAWMRTLTMWRNTGHYQTIPWTVGSYVEMEFTNGQQIAINADAITDDGTRSGSVTFALTNQTTGASLGSFTCTFTVDNDNSTAPVDYTADGWSWTSANLSTAGTYVSGSPGGRTISGINQPITIRAEVTSQGGNGQMNAGGLYLFKNGSSQGSVEWISGATKYVEATYNNGDTIDLMVDYVTWSAYRARANCVVTITNRTVAQTLATYTSQAICQSGHPEA